MTTRRSIIVKKLREFFVEQGRFLEADEYRGLDHPPIRYLAVRQSIGSWSRLKNMVGIIEPIIPEPPTVGVKAIING